MNLLPLDKIFCLMLSFSLFSGCDFPPGKKSYDKNSSSLQVDLGFIHGSPNVKLGDYIREVFTIEHVVPGGEFAEAGVKSGDIVLSHKILSFYAELNESRGGAFRFTVAEGGNGPTLSERSRREIVVFVPEIK